MSCTVCSISSVRCRQRSFSITSSSVQVRSLFSRSSRGGRNPQASSWAGRQFTFEAVHLLLQLLHGALGKLGPALGLKRARLETRSERVGRGEAPPSACWSASAAGPRTSPPAAPPSPRSPPATSGCCRPRAAPPRAPRFCWRSNDQPGGQPTIRHALFSSLGALLRLLQVGLDHRQLPGHLRRWAWRSSNGTEACSKGEKGMRLAGADRTSACLRFASSTRRRVSLSWCASMRALSYPSSQRPSNVLRALVDVLHESVKENTATTPTSNTNRVQWTRATGQVFDVSVELSQNAGHITDF